MARPDPLNKLIEQLQRLPGIGAKSAARLAYHVLKTPREEVERLVLAMREVKDRVTYCSVCSNITDVDPCFFCTSPSRDGRVICVVEEPENVNGVEKTRQFNGLYHVLMGALSPLHGVGPDDLKIKGLLRRVSDGSVEEVVLATNPNVEGEATAIYLAKLLKPLGIKVTRRSRSLIFRSSGPTPCRGDSAPMRTWYRPLNWRVRSTPLTFSGSSTTQISRASREGLVQKKHGSASVMLLHTEQ